MDECEDSHEDEFPVSWFSLFAIRMPLNAKRPANNLRYFGKNVYPGRRLILVQAWYIIEIGDNRRFNETDCDVVHTRVARLEFRAPSPRFFGHSLHRDRRGSSGASYHRGLAEWPGLQIAMRTLFIILAYILSVGLWTRPLVNNATVKNWRDVFRLNVSESRP